MRRFKGRIVLTLAALGVAGALLAGPLSGPRCTLLRGADMLSATLAPGTVGFFCYRDTDGRKLRFLLAQDQTGGVHSVFDACRQCYKFHRGYRYSNGHLICRLCGNRYPVQQMATGEASCVPVALPARVQDGKITVKVADLRAKRWLF